MSENLAYHHAIGIEHAFVFLDRCVDSTAQRLSALPFVTALTRDRTNPCSRLAEHQRACALEALQLARERGCEWLLHLDADEYAWAGNPAARPLERACLRRLLAAVPEAVEQVMLPTREAIAIRGEEPARPWQQEYFQSHNVLKRPVLDPRSGVVHTLRKWVAHSLGKSIVRTNITTAPVHSHWWHGWGARGLPRPLHSVNAGWHYHFLFRNAATWQAKYRKLALESSVWGNGQPVPFPKQAWKEASLWLDPSQAREYYRQWVAVSPATIRLLAAQGSVLRERNVQDAMATIAEKWPNLVYAHDRSGGYRIGLDG